MKLYIEYGYNECDESFLKMKTFFIETGTELVASTAISEEEGITYVLPNICGKFPSKAYSDLLAMKLVQQINITLGNKSLEKSILHGKDFFKDDIIKAYGEENYIYLSEQINDISTMEYEYLSNYSSEGQENLEYLRKKILSKMQKIQDHILKLNFDQKIQEVSSKENGKKLLQSILEFGSNRLKIANEIQEGDKKKVAFEDVYLNEYFNNAKKTIEKKVGFINIQYNENKFESLPFNNGLKKREFSEQLEIEQLAMNFEIKSKQRLKEKNRGKIGLFIDKLFRKKENTPKLLIPKSKSDNEFNFQNFQISELKKKNKNLEKEEIEK